MGTNFSDYNSNTSHVIVKHGVWSTISMPYSYSNTSHVIVKHTQKNGNGFYQQIQIHPML